MRGHFTYPRMGIPSQFILRHVGQYKLIYIEPICYVLKIHIGYTIKINDLDRWDGISESSLSERS